MTDLDKEVVRSCGWCRHSEVHGGSEPCYSCDTAVYSNYEPPVWNTPQSSRDRVAELQAEARKADTGEVRSVDSDTGAEKGVKPERYDLIPAKPLDAVARHYGIGAGKYDDRNWERGYAWSKSFAAMQRHAWAFWRGEDIDPESQSPHLAAVVFHALALMEFGRTHPEKDDRANRITIERMEPTDG